uniref:Solute carrier family 41 member n=1 Tax=Electrophorus electricus TaxID=8005 RepID=A0AAY5ERL6_ELEEL
MWMKIFTRPELKYMGQKLRGVTCKLTRSASRYPPESSACITARVLLPNLLAGLCMVATGMTMNAMQHWEMFKEISEVLILVPALLGLKGNLEMTLASRLSTALFFQHDPLLSMFLGQVQATVVGFLAPVAAVVLGTLRRARVDLQQAVVLSARLVMVGVVTGSRKVGINPDNVATPIAASLGDFITLLLLAGVSRFFYHYRDFKTLMWYVPLVTCTIFLLLIPFWWVFARRSPQIREVLRSGWQPVIVAMLISSTGGLILDKTVSEPGSEGMAVFTPIINGVGGNLVGIQASRISTYLHCISVPGVLPPTMNQHCPCPCTTFCSPGVSATSARVLLLLVVPGHLLFLYMVCVLQGGHPPQTPAFICCYLCAALLQVLILLYVADVMARLMWRRALDPDNFCIPYLTALGDLLGTRSISSISLELKGTSTSISSHVVILILGANNIIVIFSIGCFIKKF